MIEVRPVCGVVMAYAHEPCARKPGHKWEHRSAYALENDRVARTPHPRRRKAVLPPPVKARTTCPLCGKPR